jgi:hypothetical protein
MSLLSSGSKNKPSKIPGYSCYLLHAGFLLGFFVDPDDGTTYSSETSLDSQRTTQSYIPEDMTPQNGNFFFRLHGIGPLACSISELASEIMNLNEQVAGHAVALLVEALYYSYKSERRGFEFL